LLTGVTPFTGDTALAVAYRRMDNDVPAPSTIISGVPTHFDDLVLRATARDPAERYADAQDMREDLDAIVEELGLPAFRVPAPRNSAQHASAPLNPRPPRQATRELTRDDWQPYAADEEPEDLGVARQFAGIDMADFHWARQRAKRVLLLWVVVVLTLAGLVAAAGWTLGTNISALI
jgi:serine/threonine-protein kinase